MVSWHTLSQKYSQLADPYKSLRKPCLSTFLTLALLRCILTEGNVRYDGLPTEKLNLDALRSNVTIIPQVVSQVVVSNLRMLTFR